MQTFLPHPNFYHSASTLDLKRLGNQRNEAWILLQGGWPNHPAAIMWQGHHHWLCQYGLAICDTWRSYGFKDSMLLRFESYLHQLPRTPSPWWLGWEPFHSSHRAALMYKNWQFYQPRRTGWAEHPEYAYIWPHPWRDLCTQSDT